jgi:hypothetical protein
VTAPFQPFRPVGMAHGEIQFVTKSWSGGDGEYEVTFDCSSRSAHCSCMDATCRKKNFKRIGDHGLCKHSRLASEILWPVIERALTGGRL